MSQLHIYSISWLAWKHHLVEKEIAHMERNKQQSHIENFEVLTKRRDELMAEIDRRLDMVPIGVLLEAIDGTVTLSIR